MNGNAFGFASIFTCGLYIASLWRYKEGCCLSSFFYYTSDTSRTLGIINPRFISKPDENILLNVNCKEAALSGIDNDAFSSVRRGVLRVYRLRHISLHSSLLKSLPLLFLACLFFNQHFSSQHWNALLTFAHFNRY